MRIEHPDFSEAKRIILGIVHEHGGTFVGRTAMFKAFAHAHVAYWKKHGRHLTKHPIVKMQHGPGIDAWRSIFDELDEEKAWTRSGRENPLQPERYILSPDSPTVTLTDEELEAIRYGLARVRGRNVNRLSRESHGLAWAFTAGDGDEMPICLDAVSPLAFAETQASIEKLKSEFDAA